MDILLRVVNNIRPAHLTLPGSKSESNRLLLLQALFPYIIVDNVSDADDSVIMEKALQSDEQIINIHHAGTAMRFLTAYFAIQEGREVVLTGSKRMKERPIGVLVAALRALGADISYEEKEGFPPLRIKGKTLSGGTVEIDANISSQYITALMLIGAHLKNGLKIILKGNITSRPYIEMTVALLKQLDIKVAFTDNSIIVNYKPLAFNLETVYLVESDWSSASYYYSIVALSKPGAAIILSSFTDESYQGDSALAKIYEQFGVLTTFEGDMITLTKQNFKPETLNLELNNTPDIAQTIAVTCLGLGIGCELTGLHTLKIKETDRLAALKTEMEKFGAAVTITGNSLTLRPFNWEQYNPKDISIETYNDHRMAMAFAPLALRTPLIIEDAAVVSKSYPAFWEGLKAIGFTVNKL